MANDSITREELEALLNEKEKKKKKKNRWVIIIIMLLLLALLATSCGIYNLFFKGPELTPDYAPQEMDANAKDIEGADEDKLDMPEGGGAVGLTYIPEVTIDLSDNLASFMFQNPMRSNSDVVLQLVIQDQILAQSGKLTPGKQLDSMELLRGAADMLSPGGYDGKFVILFYDPVSAERSVLKSEGAVTINVVA